MSRSKQAKQSITKGINVGLHYLSLFAADIIFGFFMLSQETDDTSFLKTF